MEQYTRNSKSMLQKKILYGTVIYIYPYIYVKDVASYTTHSESSYANVRTGINFLSFISFVEVFWVLVIIFEYDCDRWSWMG